MCAKIVLPLNPMPDGTCRTLRHNYAPAPSNFMRTTQWGVTGVLEISRQDEQTTPPESAQPGEEPRIIVVGNLSASGHLSHRIVDPAGIAQTIMENHGYPCLILEPQNNERGRKADSGGEH